MNKIIISAALLLTSLVAMAQNTGINTTNPKATLDIKAKTTDGSQVEGLLIPRLEGTAIQQMTPTIDSKSMLVYATSSGLSQTAEMQQLQAQKDQLEQQYTTLYNQYIAALNQGNTTLAQQYQDQMNPLASQYGPVVQQLETATSNFSNKGVGLEGFYYWKGDKWSKIGDGWLDRVTEGGKTGYRLRGEDTKYHGNIGQNALDLSIQNENTYSTQKYDPTINVLSSITSYEGGATGNNSIAIGYGAVANGDHAISIGRGKATKGGIVLGYGEAEYGLAINGNAKSGTAIANGSGISNRSGSVVIGVNSFSLQNDEVSPFNNEITNFKQGGSGWGVAIGGSAGVQAEYATSIGSGTHAKGFSSFASGHYTLTTQENEYAAGRFNQSFPGVAFSIGNGFMSYPNGKPTPTRRNALVIMDSNYTANQPGNSKIGINMPYNANNPNDYSNSLPTEMLDVNGNIRSRTISTNTGANTDKVVVANTDGVLKSVDRSGFASPYAAGAGISINNNVISRTGLELLTENSKTGWGLIGRVQEQAFGNTGLDAVTFTTGREHQSANTFGSTGDYAFSANWRNTASGVSSTAFGSQNIASGHSSITFGGGNTASEKNSMAIGESTKASGINSLAIGYLTKAIGERSFAGGRLSESSGISSFAFGDSSKAQHVITTAFGEQTIADSPYMMAVGSKNTPLITPLDINRIPNVNDKLFVVGDGSYNTPFTKSDAFTVLYGGKVGISIDNFETNSSNAKLQVNGKVLIGDFGDNSTGNNTISSAPNSDASLNVLGEVKIGSKNITCNATNEGSIRYVKTAGVGNFEGCRDNNGTFGWIRINP